MNWEMRFGPNISYTIALNCIGLQRFDFKVNVNLNDDYPYFNPDICFQSISYLRGLKTLSFCIYCKQPITELSALKNCKGLVILKVSINLTNQIFDRIHLFAPQLKKLSFE